MKKEDFNKTLVGKVATVSSNEKWTGKIVRVVDEEHFEVECAGEVVVVNIFDIKSTKDGKRS